MIESPIQTMWGTNSFVEAQPEQIGKPNIDVSKWLQTSTQTGNVSSRSTNCVVVIVHQTCSRIRSKCKENTYWSYQTVKILTLTCKRHASPAAKQVETSTYSYKRGSLSCLWLQDLPKDKRERCKQTQIQHRSLLMLCTYEPPCAC